MRRMRNDTAHYLPDARGFLDVECWCGEQTVQVKKVDLDRGLTGPCPTVRCLHMDDKARGVPARHARIWCASPGYPDRYKAICVCGWETPQFSRKKMAVDAMDCHIKEKSSGR